MGWFDLSSFMTVLLWLDVVREPLCGLGEQVDKRAILGLEPATLGAGQSPLRESKLGHVGQRLPEMVEFVLQVFGQRTHGGGAGSVGPYDGKRIVGERPPLSLGGGTPPRRHEGQRLAVSQAVRVDGPSKCLLIRKGYSTQGVGHRWREASLIDTLLQGGGEPGGQRVAARHPGLFLSQQAGHGAQRHAVLVDQGRDHPRFVHGRHGAPRGVGAKQDELGLCGAAGTLHHHGHTFQACVLPAFEPLEAVCDLQRAVFLQDDSDRQL
jgi:hypothetical protein